jgi:hypothetical protein
MQDKKYSETSDIINKKNFVTNKGFSYYILFTKIRTINSHGSKSQPIYSPAKQKYIHTAHALSPKAAIWVAKSIWVAEASQIRPRFTTLI